MAEDKSTKAHTFCDPDTLQEYRLILDNLNEGVWRFDESGLTTFATRRMAQMLGCEVDDMQGRSLYDFLDESGRAKAKRRAERHEDGIAESDEIELIRKDGRRIYTLIETSPIVDESGTYRGTVAGVTDISARHEAEARLRRFGRAVETAGHAMYMTDPMGIIEYVNPAFSTVTLWSAEEAIGKTPRILKSGLQAPEYYSTLWSAILAGKVWNEEVINRRKDGSIYHAHQTVAPFYDEAGVLEGFVAIQTDISERKRLEEQLLQAAETDFLTGAWNRYKLYTLLRDEIARSSRYKIPLSVLMLDIDHFKVVNDSYGHDAGDRALKALSAIATAMLRSSDRFARWGGEEFLIMAPNTDQEESILFAERLRAAIATSDEEGRPHITVSIGTASFRSEDGLDAALMIKRADEALYRAKAAGRNRVMGAD
jgi:diguanylate cyclase (GGDEF)-like protein/PAS domain S-box-containing protein